MAISIATEAWSILDGELRKDGFGDEILPYEEGSRHDYWDDLDCQILEDADSIFFNSSERAQLLDTVDLHYFESCFDVRNCFSPRIKALALRTLAKDLVNVSEFLSEKDVENALDRVAFNADGTVDVIATYSDYRPFFPLE